MVATTLILVLAGVGLVIVTKHGDTISIQRQVLEAQTAVQASIDELARTQEITAVWDTPVLELRKSRPNWQWVDDHIGTWLFTMFKHDQVYILDARDRPIYAASAGRRVDPSRFSSISSSFPHFVEAVRGRIVDQNNPHERLPGLPLNSGTSVRTTSAAIHATDLTRVNGRPAAVSIMRMVPQTNAVEPAPGRELLLVSIRYLDGNLLDELETRSLLKGARISAANDTKPGEAAFPLSSSHGQIGYFAWKPQLPGSELQGYLALLIGGLALLMVLIMSVLARSLYKAMSEQHEAQLELQSAMIELQASEAQAQHLAFHDVLTGLPNRALFRDRMGQALAQCRRNRGVALLMLDLDRFKRVNDTLGHVAGDSLIREFAARLGPLLDSRATLARLGGDEFVILLPTVRAKEKVYELCERILELVREPFEVVGTQAFVGVSIGVVFSPDAGTGRMELMRKADIALYRAKADGRDCFRVFEREMDDTVRFRSEIENDLRTALESGSQLRVFYQPQIASAGKRVVGLEALVRWQHPTRGLMSPETFIEIAEDTGLIAELGEWVLKEACGAASRWPTLYIGVNLSPLQFKLPNFSERLIGIVRDAGVCAGQLELEVTETVLLQDDEMVRQELVRLREAGFKIALDDFGTGYSSLSHLHRFEVDRIKVDRTFVKNLGKLDSAAIITAVVNLGHAMGLKVTAEGVETEEQSEFLTAAGCDVMQGHLFAHALPEAELARLMTEQEQLRRAA